MLPNKTNALGQQKAPYWLNDILASEGWFPIVDVDG